MKQLALVLALAAMRTPGVALPVGTLPSLDGGSVNLQSLKGRPAVIAVFAGWCDPCKADMPSVIAAAKANPRVQFLGIDALEPASRARAFVRATGVPFRTALLTSDAFAAPGTTDEQRAATGIDIPAVYVLDRNAIVVQAFVGDDAHVGEKVDEALRRLAAVPRIVAPGTISTGGDEAGGVLSPDGKEFYFVEFAPYTIAPRLGLICVSYLRDGRWQTPQALPFSGRTLDFPPRLSPDGTTMYFASFRRSPASPARTIRIWIVRRTKTGWSDPVPLPAPINQDDSYNADPSVTADGTLYFSSTRGDARGHFHIFRATMRDGAYATPERLSAAVNQSADDVEPFVSGDEHSLLFATFGGLIAGGAPYPREDIFVSHRTNGTWSLARPVAGGVNTFAVDAYPSLSPDGRTLFFSSERSIFGVPLARRIDEARFEAALRGIENGRGNIYAVDASAAGV